MTDIIDSNTIPIPKDIPADKTLFFDDHCQHNQFIPDIDFILYIDPKNLMSERNETLTMGLVDVISELLGYPSQKKIMIIVPNALKLKNIHHQFKTSNYLIWVEIKSEARDFKADKINVLKSEIKNMLHQGVFLKKVKLENLNQRLLVKFENQLPVIAPHFFHYNHLVKLIDLKAVLKNEQLCLSLNATLNQKICFISSQPCTRLNIEYPSIQNISTCFNKSDPNWRKFMAFEIANQLDFELFGVKAFYLIGSAKNDTTGLGSDIDLIIHINGDENQRTQLSLWLEGWSRCLSIMNYLRTGYETDGILDVHYITDESIIRKDSFAVKINAVTDPALLIKTRID